MQNTHIGSHCQPGIMQQHDVSNRNSTRTRFVQSDVIKRSLRLPRGIQMAPWLRNTSIESLE